MYRPVPWKGKGIIPSRRDKKKNVQSRREKLYAPSRLVEKNKNTVRSIRDNFYLPSLPVVAVFICYLSRPVMQQKVIVLYTVPSRRKNSHPPVPFHPGN